MFQSPSGAVLFAPHSPHVSVTAICAVSPAAPPVVGWRAASGTDSHIPSSAAMDPQLAVSPSASLWSYVGGLDNRSLSILYELRNRR